MMGRSWLVGLLLLGTHLMGAQRMTDTLSIFVRDVPMEAVFDSISLKTGYLFSYNADAIPQGGLYYLRKQNAHVDSVLTQLFMGMKLEFSRKEGYIIVKPKSDKEQVTVERSKSSEIYGTVRSAADEPVIGASVFINGSTLGTITDVNGQYALKNVPPGRHQLVFSHLEYETRTRLIFTEKHHTYLLNMELMERIVQLAQVEVSARRIAQTADWRRHYQTFEREFLGGSANASKCQIVNPAVLEFEYHAETDVLLATSLQPLEVRNEALGYRLSCQLESFRKEANTTTFHIRVFFENLAPNNRAERKRWKRNRLAAYNGSPHHFYRSLLQGKTRGEGFEVYLLTDSTAQQSRDKDLISVTESGREVFFEGTLLIEYHREPLPSTEMQLLSELDYRMLHRQLPALTLPRQRSYVQLLDGPVEVYESGQLRQPAKVRAIGYWSWERVADLMPANYNPKKDGL